MATAAKAVPARNMIILNKPSISTPRRTAAILNLSRLATSRLLSAPFTQKAETPCRDFRLLSTSLEYQLDQTIYANYFELFYAFE
jgi:hypothetical protein